MCIYIYKKLGFLSVWRTNQTFYPSALSLCCWAPLEQKMCWTNQPSHHLVHWQLERNSMIECFFQMFLCIWRFWKVKSQQDQTGPGDKTIASWLTSSQVASLLPISKLSRCSWDANQLLVCCRISSATTFEHTHSWLHSKRRASLSTKELGMKCRFVCSPGSWKKRTQGQLVLPQKVFGSKGWHSDRPMKRRVCQIKTNKPGYTGHALLSF